MIEIIFNGRGGQGAVTAAQILATAAFQEGKFSHALPYFRAERKGAPVIAYTRISEDALEVRGSVDKADILLILDAALLKSGNVLANSSTGQCVASFRNCGKRGEFDGHESVSYSCGLSYTSDS